MCEDLSLRERPRRHEIDHEMAISRERPRRHVMARGIYRTAGGPGLELCDYFIKGYCRLCSARRGLGAWLGGQRPTAHAAPSAHANSRRQRNRTARPPNNKLGRTRVVT